MIGAISNRQLSLEQYQSPQKFALNPHLSETVKTTGIVISGPFLQSQPKETLSSAMITLLASDTKGTVLNHIVTTIMSALSEATPRSITIKLSPHYEKSTFTIISLCKNPETGIIFEI